MILLKKYQDEAVNDLSEKLFKLLKKPNARQNLIFKAPTGAGKTIMMAAFLNQFCEELPNRYDLEKRKAAFIWIAPNKLYIQSYNALKGYFAEMRSIKPIFFTDISDNQLQPSEVLFLNWESINKDKNLMVRDNESGKTLFNFINNAKLNDTEIIVIIDEEHMFANTKTAKRANEVLQKIYPKIEIRVSATPTTNSDYKTLVERQDVIAEEMIKEGIMLNPALDTIVQQGRSLEEILLEQALAKREELRQAYESLGVKINPLLLIQLPNDTSDNNTVDDEKYIDLVLQNLEVKYNITVNNNKLAVWLSGRKDNVEDIEKPDNMVEVLLFKQAIALGWDCPRAGVLLIFRELKSTTFTIQTVGRILRMPQQKHYPNPMLNQGYVFTNLSKNQIEIVKDDMSYITMNKARRIENYMPVQLNSTYINTRIVRNRLGATFRKALYEIAELNWELKREMGSDHFFETNKQLLKKRFINTDINTIEIVIPENLRLTGEEEIVLVNEKVKFAKTPSELARLFHSFCRSLIAPYAAVDSTPVLEGGLKYFFEDYFGIIEYDAIKIMLFDQNQSIFIELIEKAKERYQEMLEQKANNATKDVQNYQWEVPIERIYNELYEEKETVQKHALEPFYQYNKASKPEVKFAEFLEENKENLHWWYKNGEKAKEHFAIPYIDYLGKQSLFYVDFIILSKTNVTCLFDTKTAGSDPANAHLKHNALVDFIAERNARGLKTIGGILIEKSPNNISTWWYCNNKITNTKDTTGWDMFKPAE
ncbi:Type III restriction enzyme, res subunit [Flavobacterium psychrophilum]|uniref:DEAD/DEAH box helicase n=1 Tax=Flavobacterium psychrophilum TaxID=96345 RepID=UPI000B7C25AE|nr:DEAD/DEAH box helicase family protein [Flavobacterium psychrophilum]MCB6062423.1 DEAD/DEAH box helicase family protein [Flavobacterium psychrophilum]SNB43265.1 Type III restriction enzyme, res subunit [Flavobacterium psychrophilum]